MKTQMVKWGNSLAVRIPKPVVEEAKLKEGDALEIEAAAEGRVELRRATKTPTLAQLVSQITPENRYAEISTGAEVGMMDFDPQVVREQAKRRPALVLTDQRYNRASGLAVVCPLTSKRKPYPFALPITVDQVEGAVLVDQLKSMDWGGRKAKFHSKAEPALVGKVRQYVAVLLALR
jgi:mRNA-degrading endonuclease toxin of MazEF toxin-antitoxin module